MGDQGDPARDDPDEVEIRADEECPHEHLQRIGQDGGLNSYCRCVSCSATIIKLGPELERAGSDRSMTERTEPIHPLVGMLSPESVSSREKRRSQHRDLADESPVRRFFRALLRR